MTRVLHTSLLIAALAVSGCLKLPETPAPAPAPAPVDLPDPDADVIVGVPTIEL